MAAFRRKLISSQQFSHCRNRFTMRVWEASNNSTDVACYVSSCIEIRLEPGWLVRLTQSERSEAMDCEVVPPSALKVGFSRCENKCVLKRETFSCFRFLVVPRFELHVISACCASWAITPMFSVSKVWGRAGAPNQGMRAPAHEWPNR